LDAGCGLGLFLELLGDGYDRIGVDVNPLAVDFTRDRVDVEVRRMDLMDVWFEPGALDAAVVMQTLDHLHRPGDFLDRSAGWLRPGGVLFLSSLININSLCGRWFGPDFRLLHPFHAVYFTPATLRRHLAERGLKVIRLEYPYFNTPYFHWRDAVDLAVRGAGRLVGRRGRPSPPFWGNTINAWAVKEA
jgi:SAM-dependent methyltransferase